MLDQINVNCSAKEIFSSLPILNLPKTQLNVPTGDFFYDAWQLKDEFKKSAILDLFAQLGSVGEARIIVLEPGESNCAANLGYKSRIQLVIRKLLNQVTLQDPCRVKVIVNTPPYNLRYLFDNSFSMVLNRLNKQGCMNKFKKVSETEITFEIEHTHLPQIMKLKNNCGFNVEIQHE